MDREGGRVDTVTREDFLAQVEAIAATHPTYRLGGSGKDGTCDCIGLIIGAIRRAGGAWTGTHGSNYAARYAMTTLGAITAAELLPGMVVYKAWERGNGKYALPGRYKGSADKRDYYHVGVVTGVQPLVITHCTGPGILRDKALGKWRFGGWLKQVEPAGDAALPAADMQATAVVMTSNGGAARLRARPTKKCGLYWNVPCGAVVDVVTRETGSPGWWQVRYQGRSGFMMAELLR